jgi:Na+/H+ antiporter NhaB
MNAQLLEALDGAQTIIREPKNWTKGWFAKDKHNNFCDSDAPEAVCFCTIGALNRACLGDYELFKAGRDLVNEASSTPNVADFNDHHLTTHADIMRLFEKAKALVSVNTH